MKSRHSKACLIRIRLVFSTITAIFLFMMASPSFASAEKQPVVTISPFLKNISFSENEATPSFSISLTNTGPNQLKIHLSPVDFGSLNETGGVVFAGSQASSLITKYSLADWLQLSTPDIVIDPGQKTDIKATIINNASLRPGGHYAAIVATVDNPDRSSTEINIDQKLSSLIFATKQGGEKYDLRLDSIEFGSSKLHLPESATLRFTNPGNVHVTPRGTVKIVSPNGKVVSKGIINEESSYVMPETSRQLAVNLKPVNSAGLWPAFYHIQVDYRYEGIDRFAHKDQVLFFLNAPHILLSGILLLVLGWLSWKYKVRIGNKFKQLIPNLKIKLRKLTSWIKKATSEKRQSIKARQLVRVEANKEKDKAKKEESTASNQEKERKAAAKVAGKASAAKVKEEQRLLKKVDEVQEKKPAPEKKPKKLKLKKVKRPATQPVLLWSRMDRTASAQASSSQKSKPKTNKTRSSKSPKKS